MKILIVTTEIGQDGGGMALSCERIVSILSKEHDVRIISSTDYPIYTAMAGTNPLIAKCLRKEFKLKEDALRNKDIDVVIGFGGRFNGYYASLLAERLHKRFILSLRGSDTNIVKWSIEDCWYLQEACRRASKIICLSQEMVDNVLSISPSSNGNVITIPNAMSGQVATVLFPNLPSHVVIGCAASHLNEKKGIGNLILMVNEFKKISPLDIKLVLVGEIDSELRMQYEDKAKEYNVKDCTLLKGYMSRMELEKEMRNWDFYIQGSVCEGHPNAITECMRLGKGFISSNTGFIAEILQKEYPEFFFSTWEPNVMAKELLKVIEDNNKGKKYEEAFNVLINSCQEENVEKSWLSLVSYNKSFHKDLNIEHVLALGLHDIKGNLHDSITTPVNVFEDFVHDIYKSGYGLCSMRDYLSKSKVDRRGYIVCTFDDGYQSLTNDALRILSKYGFTATVFVCTGLIGKDNTWNNKDATLREHLNLDGIKKLNNAGWEIASHGVMHKNLLKLNDKEIAYELGESKKTLLEVVGYADCYAYPYGAFNKFIRRCVEKYYRYAFAVDQGGTSILEDRYQIKRYSITEIYRMIKLI